MPLNNTPCFHVAYHPSCLTVCLLGVCLVLALSLVPGGAKNAPATAANAGGLIQLKSSDSIVGELAGGGRESFEIPLSAGQLLQFSIEKGDLCLSLVLYAPGGEKLLEHVSHAYELLEVSSPADSAGMYRLELRSLEQAERPRQYSLRVEPLRSATEKDRQDSAARRAIAEASLLRTTWKETSLRKAIEKYREAERIWRSLGNSQKAVVASMSAGQVYFLLAESSEALNRYENAAREAGRAGARLEEAEAFAQIGRLHSYLGNNTEAQPWLRKALDYFVSRGGVDNPEVKHPYAEALTGLGEVEYSKGNLVKSSKHLEQSLKLFGEIGDRRGEARARLFIGYLAGGLGESEKAVSEISQALASYRAIADKAGEALSLTALGLSHSLKRDEEHAIGMHREAREIFRTIGDGQSEAVTLNAVGQAYENLGEHEISIDNYRQALILAQKVGNLDLAAVATYQIAAVYWSVGDRARGLANYEECLRLSRAANNTRLEANALTDIAAIYAAQGNRAKTLRQYQELMKFYERNHDRRMQAVVLNSMGDFLLPLGEKERALSLYEQALPLSEQIGDQGVMLSTLHNIARARRESGALDDALSSIRRSIKIIEDTRTNVANPDFRSSYFAAVRKHYDLYIDILMQFEQLRPGQGFAAAALVASETARARTLIDVLTEARADIRHGVDPALLKRERELQSLLRAEAQYKLELSSSGKNPNETAEASSQIDQLMAEYQEIQAQVRNQNALSLILIQPAPLSLQDIQGELADGNTILLEFALGDDKSYLWAVTADSIRSYDLPPRKVLEDAGREVYELVTTRQATTGQIDSGYQAKVAAADRSYYEKALHLSEMLFGQVKDQLGNKRLVVVTEGVLQYVPLDALPTPAKQTAGQTGNEAWANAAELPPLITTHEIVTLPSISTLTAIRRAKRRTSSRNKLVAVLADPVFSKDDDRVENANQNPVVAVSNSAEALSEPALQNLQTSKRNLVTMRLGHATEEADAILAATPRGAGMVVKGFEASRQTAMSSLVGQYQIVHFATHGFMDSQHPEFSGIVLTMVNKDGTKADGFMPLHDIYNLNLSADLTVLSACETALGKDIKGEGLVGLTRGFMHAGSRSVVASLWKVDDRATAVLMAHFYKAMLQDGMPPAAALRAAKETVRQQHAWREPYFWAGFVLQGEYKEPIVADNEFWLRIGLVGMLALSLISSGLITWKMRRRRSVLVPRQF